MDANNGIDSKPRLSIRARGRRRTSEKASSLSIDQPDDPIDDTDVEQVLNVRVKERESDAGRRLRLGSIFKEPPSTAIKGLFNKEQAHAHDLKDTIKRPLTGLFRRPGSRAGSMGVTQKEVKTDSGLANVEVLASGYTTQGERSITPEISHIDRQLVQESVAHAPSISVHRVAAMYQLDALNSKNAFLAKLDEIDLSLLSRYLCSDEEVKDERVGWTWDYVFASISTEMREEWAMDDEQDEENYDDRNRNA